MRDDLNSFLDAMNIKMLHYSSEVELRWHSLQKMFNDEAAEQNRNRPILPNLPPEMAFERVKLMRIELKLAELKEVRREQKEVLRKRYMVCFDAD